MPFKPDWTRHAKAAPFKRNDQILEVLPIGVIVFPGSGIQENLADKARKLGIRTSYSEAIGFFPSSPQRTYVFYSTGTGGVTVR